MLEVRVAPVMPELSPLQEQSLHSFIVLEDGKLAAAWGVVGSVAGSTCAVWGKVFTPIRKRRELALLTRRWRNWLRSIYPNIVALVEDENLRWVRALGFERGNGQLVTYRRG